MTCHSKKPGEALTSLLKSRRDPQGIAMANELGVALMTVYRWKKSSDMTLSRIERIASYFGLTICQFLSWEEKNESDNSDIESPIEATDNGTRSFT